MEEDFKLYYGFNYAIQLHGSNVGIKNGKMITQCPETHFLFRGNNDRYWPELGTYFAIVQDNTKSFVKGDNYFVVQKEGIHYTMEICDIKGKYDNFTGKIRMSSNGYLALKGENLYKGFEPTGFTYNADVNSASTFTFKRIN
jgi:hypothetical protein